MHHHHRSSVSWGARAAWLGSFVLAAALFGAGLTCAVPLVAFAAICALRQSRGYALLSVGLLWLAGELMGFTVLHFPLGAVALGWGALVGAALLAAAWAAGSVARRLPGATGIVAAFVTAFGLYECVLWTVSRMVGAAAGAFTAAILTQVFILNAVTFVALLLVGALTTRSTARASLLATTHSAQRTA